MISASAFSRIGAAAVFLAMATLPGLRAPAAQVGKPVEAPKSTVTVDGAKEPEKIPEWILWREIFRRAADSADLTRSQGRSYWMEHLRLTSLQIEHLLAFGGNYRNEDAKLESDARKLAQESAGAASDAVKEKLHQMQMDRETNVLVYRDMLRKLIGEDAYARLQSFARLQVAPTIKMGRLDKGR